MQRHEMVAFVAGAGVGMVGGALGVFLACIAGEVAVRRLLDQLVDHYIELRQPPHPAAQPGAPQANPETVSAAPVNVPPSPPAKEAVIAAMSR